MSKRELVFVGQVYSYTEGDREKDAVIYFDPETLEFFVMEQTEGAGQGESGLIPAADYVKQNPEWAEDVRRTIVEQFQPAAR